MTAPTITNTRTLPAGTRVVTSRITKLTRELEFEPDPNERNRGMLTLSDGTKIHVHVLGSTTLQRENLAAPLPLEKPLPLTNREQVAVKMITRALESKEQTSRKWHTRAGDRRVVIKMEGESFRLTATGGGSPTLDHVFSSVESLVRSFAGAGIRNMWFK